jgi:hypothetical protein
MRVQMSLKTQGKSGIYLPREGGTVWVYSPRGMSCQCFKLIVIFNKFKLVNHIFNFPVSFFPSAAYDCELNINSVLVMKWKYLTC